MHQHRRENRACPLRHRTQQAAEEEPRQKRRIHAVRRRKQQRCRSRRFSPARSGERAHQIAAEKQLLTDRRKQRALQQHRQKQT